jgi:hypothetical protein
MDALKTVMTQIDNVKDKLTEGEYLQLCNDLKKVADTKKRFIKVICVESIMVGFQEDLEDGNHSSIMSPMFMYNHEDEGDANIHLTVKQRVNFHTLECVSADDPDAPMGFWLDKTYSKARLHNEEQLEKFKKYKLQNDDHLTYIYVDDYYS